MIDLPLMKNRTCTKPLRNNPNASQYQQYVEKLFSNYTQKIIVKNDQCRMYDVNENHLPAQ